MTKDDLLKNMSTKTGLSKKDCDAAIKSFSENVVKAMKKGESLRLTELGTFSVSKVSARTGRNPRTGAEIKIPAKKVIRFKSAKFVREELNK